MQIAVSATNVVCPVWATRKLPDEVDTSAALPTFASGEAASTVSDTTRLLTLPLTIGRGGALMGPPSPSGAVGLLPPQPSRSDARVASEAAWHAWTQNSLRVLGSMATRFCNTCASVIGVPQGADQPTPMRPDTPRRRVLVVEDELPIREILRLHLELAGFDLDEVGDGRDALDRPRPRKLR